MKINTRFLLIKAREAYKNKAFDVAKALYTDLLECDPTVAEAWHQVGVLYAQEQQMDAAKEYIEMAVKIEARLLQEM